MSNSEPVDSPPDSLAALGSAAIGFKDLKVAMFIFVIFLVLCSDVFVQRVLAYRNKQFVSNGLPTAMGTIMQAGMMALGFVSVNTLVKHDFL